MIRNIISFLLVLALAACSSGPLSTGIEKFGDEVAGPTVTAAGVQIGQEADLLLASGNGMAALDHVMAGTERMAGIAVNLNTGIQNAIAFENARFMFALNAAGQVIGLVHTATGAIYQGAAAWQILENEPVQIQTAVRYPDGVPTNTQIITTSAYGGNANADANATGGAATANPHVRVDGDQLSIGDQNLTIADGAFTSNVRNVNTNTNTLAVGAPPQCPPMTTGMPPNCMPMGGGD